MRLLILGDAAGTGFGTVTRDLGAALLAEGADVRFMDMNEGGTRQHREYPLAGRMIRFDVRSGWHQGISPVEHKRLLGLLHSGVELTDQDRVAFEGYIRVYELMTGILNGQPDETGWTAEAVLAIGDPGSMETSRLPQLLGTIPAFHYVPIEGIDSPPRWATLWQHMTPIAMSEFGAGEIERITGNRPAVAYHGVDPEAFWPVSELRPITMPAKVGPPIRLTSRKACKEFVAHGARMLNEDGRAPDPNRLWILRADRHMPRKMYSSLFRSLSLVLRRFADVEFVYHCRTWDEGGHLDNDRSKYPDVMDRITPTGYHDAPGVSGATREALNAIYNAADIYVSASAEGFGLTIAEAMLTGCAVVGLDYSAVPEVIGDAGVLVPAGGLVDNVYGYFWARPDETKMADAIAKLITSRGARRDLGTKATDRIRTRFRWETAAQVIYEAIEQKQAVAA